MNSIKFNDAPPAELLKREAKKRFEEWAPNEGKSYDAAQGAVNYIRHVLSNYDDLRRTIRVEAKDENNDPDVLSLKLETLAGIKERYPEYRTECVRQEEWLRGRAKALEYSRAKYSSPNPGLISMSPALDLIGASAEETFSLNSRIGELEKALAEKEATVARLRAELDAIRRMGVGPLYDELMSLRTRTDDSDQLKKFSEALGLISSVIAGLGDLTATPTPERKGSGPKKSRQSVAAKASWARRRAEQAAKAKGSCNNNLA